MSDRRSELAQEIRATTDPATRTGLQDRLRLLDQRILQLETDLATTGQQLAATPSELVTSTQAAPSGGDDSFEGGMAAGGFSALLLIPIVLYFARRRWRRPAAPAIAGQSGRESARLERLENGMDAIAIEIERISEGQRFVTKLLSESQPPLSPQRIPQSATESDPAKR